MKIPKEHKKRARIEKKLAKVDQASADRAQEIEKRKKEKGATR